MLEKELKNLKSYNYLEKKVKLPYKRYPYHYFLFYPPIVIPASHYGCRIISEKLIDTNLALIKFYKDNIKFYEPEKEMIPEIIKKFNNIFTINRKIEHYLWKYYTDRNNCVISCGFSPNGDLISHVSGYPMYIYIKKINKIEKILHTGDVFTLPEVRNIGKGRTSIFSRMLRYYVGKAITKGYKYAYGVLTHVSYIMFKRYVETEDIEEISYLTLHKNNFKIFNENFLKKLINDIKIFKNFDKSFDDLFEENKNMYGEVVFVRNSQYLNWRFSDPEKNFIKIKLTKLGKLIGYCVLEIKNNFVTIGDIFWDLNNLNSLKYLINFIYKKFNAEIIELWLSKSCIQLYNAILNIGFIPSKQPDNLKIVIGIYNDQYSLPSLKNKVFYTKSDCDLF